MIQKFILVTLFLMINLHAMSFSEAIAALDKHESVEAVRFKLQATKEEATLKGSWGDPTFKIAAKNFPTDTLSYSQTPMTGVEYTLSQKIPLTTKYSKLSDAFHALSQSYHYAAQDKKEMLIKTLWEVLIVRREIAQQLGILKESRAWIEKILKVSKQLYATGKVSQQALLDIEIRKSELERDISNKSFERSQIDDKLGYLIGRSDLDTLSIPWKTIEQKLEDTRDNRALGLYEKLKVKEHQLEASKLNTIPDVTLSVGYTQRSDIDNHGDFLSASIMFKLPFSDQRSSQYAIALQEKLQVQQDYEDYKRAKKRDVALIEHEINKLSSEIAILDNKMIKFATNSREITSKSYITGDSTYIELLQSELQLQKILMQKVMLLAQRDRQRVGLKYIKGEPLYE